MTELDLLKTIAEWDMGYVPTHKSTIRLCRELERKGFLKHDETSPFLAVLITTKGERALLAAQMFGGQDD